MYISLSLWLAKGYYCLSWFQTFAMFWMLYSFFWVIPRRQNFMCWRFGTMCLFRLRRWCKQLSALTTYEDGTDTVFRNVDTWNSDAGELPKRKNITTFSLLFYFSRVQAIGLEALRYKPEGRGFDFRWRHWIFFHWHNPSGRTLALGLTQPLTEMNTRYVSWGQRRPVHRADNLATFMCRLSWNLGASAFWNLQGASRPVMGLLYLYLLQAVGLIRPDIRSQRVRL
jgi:hypothetical protein